jgi:hypothetical protein
MARPMIWVHLMDSEVTVAIISLCEVERSQTGQLRLQEVQICVQDISFVTNIVLVGMYRCCISCDGVNVQLIVSPSIHSL